ncbi:GGDEF domain-containing protein [Halomonas beimenensis]|uniref:diguanylate cyclase n=1 Tax=Halomonas beimenensis TaxID=475662 RepID=A0A291P3T0_9GAMM|nr:sensor domain-containing diguanylate cyclase [Halomonas beimenensis]ATJ81515.1 diguanylate cyclase/phosphodiesterase (GGDEF & EAL domains) with PAS/PAC sensor(s) [Halomonas beimenensis]
MPLNLTHPDNIPRLIRAAPLGICITDAEGLFEMVNPAYCDFYGYREEELIGRHFTMLVPEADRARLGELHERFIRGQADQEIRQEWEVVRKDGERRSIIAEAARIVDERGEVKQATFVTDITERKRLERRLEFLARHDELTGLLNRRAGLARLDEEIARTHRHDIPLCVAICDLDHFKQINDRHGHGVGDEALAAVAEVMQSELRRYDVLARLGGEEFLVILPGATLSEAERSIERLRRRLVETRLASPGLSLTLSAGLAALKEGDAGDALLERADRALYRAKREGRNRVTPA